MRNYRPFFSCLTLLTGAAGFFAIPSRSSAAPQISTTSTGDRAFLNQYCLSCHNGKMMTGGLSLERLDPADIAHNGETLEKIVRKVWSGSMPPAQAPRPNKAAVHTFLTSLETSLDHYASVRPFAGRPTMLHRLNRNEYMNAVHDLLGIEMSKDDASLLPADDLSYGFDNNGDVLGVAPLLLERYLSVARRVSLAALGPAPHTEAPINVYTQTLEFGGPSQSKWREGLPLGTRGGTAFTYHFPADGEYSIKVKLQRRNSRIVGFPNLQNVNPAQMDEVPPRQRLLVGLDGKTTALFLIGADQTIQEAVPHAEQGLADLPEPPVKELARVDRANRGFNGDNNLEFHFKAKAGDRQVFAAFLARYVALSTQVREPYAAGQGGDAAPMGIYSVAITGPYHSDGPGDTPSRRRIFTCHPATTQEEAPCAKSILTALARRAYRRPPTSGEMQELLTAYERGRKNGDFEAGFGLAIRRTLMDPAFLFRIERDPPSAAPGTPYRLTDMELASRLSFFLWSSIPDDQLLKVAEQGRLRQPDVLVREVRRMLADPKAHSLVSNFASEWLGLRVVAGVQPDPVIFSDFDGLKQAFQRETELLLSYVLLGDKPVLDLLNGNYTFVNERLARHYGVPDIYGDQFRLITLHDGNRGGLLGQGGILTATSYPNRTSPVLRGKWILDNLLGSPPPPPPAVVPPFPEADGSGKTLSVRERLTEHRKNAACAGCHSRMDPLGFALESFDATGKWRSGESASLADLTLQPIDATGQLPDGTKFDGIKGLKAVLKDHSDEFVYTMTERLLTYGLGRGAEWYDAPALRAAMRTAKQNDYRFSSIVLSLVNSTPFQMRMAQEQEPDKKAQLNHQPRLTAHN